MTEARSVQGTGERRIVVGVDGSEGSQTALDWAAEEACRRGAVLEMVTTWGIPAIAGYFPDPEFATSIEEEARRVSIDAASRAEKLCPGVVVRGEMAHAPAALTLVDASRGADLLVVGSRGMGGFRGLMLGSVSQYCVHHAHCPVVIVRPTDEVTD